MRILNEQGKEIAEDQVDLDLGHLEQDFVFVRHHEAVPSKGEVGHTAVTVTFADGTDAVFYSYPVEWFDENKQFLPHGEYDKEVASVDEDYVVDEPYQPGQEAWDENEEILRYILYTQAELDEIADRKAQELAQQEQEAKKQVEEANRAVALTDLTLVNATALGDYSETEAQVGDLTLVMADLIGA